MKKPNVNPIDVVFPPLTSDQMTEMTIDSNDIPIHDDDIIDGYYWP